MRLEEEGDRLLLLLKGKTVVRVFRRRSAEVGLEFSDGTRLFVDGNADRLELSVTGVDEGL